MAYSDYDMKFFMNAVNQKVDRATYIAEVKEIMDDAIANASKGGLKKAFMKKRTSEGKKIIHEKDFQ